MGGASALRRALKPALAITVSLATVTGAAGSSSGFGAVGIRITSDGLLPASAQLGAYSAVPVWTNEDSVDRTLTFLDGRCTVTIPPNGRTSCPFRSMLYAGTYRYHVSGTDESGEIIVVPQRRSLTLAASRTTTRAGQVVTFTGQVAVGSIASPPPYAQTLTLLQQRRGSRRFMPVKKVVCMPRYCPRYAWSVTIRPQVTATYVARAADGRDEVVWQDAESNRVVVRVTTP